MWNSWLFRKNSLFPTFILFLDCFALISFECWVKWNHRVGGEIERFPPKCFSYVRRISHRKKYKSMGILTRDWLRAFDAPKKTFHFWPEPSELGSMRAEIVSTSFNFFSSVGIFLRVIHDGASKVPHTKLHPMRKFNSDTLFYHTKSISLNFKIIYSHDDGKIEFLLLHNRANIIDGKSTLNWAEVWRSSLFFAGHWKGDTIFFFFQLWFFW